MTSDKISKAHFSESRAATRWMLALITLFAIMWQLSGEPIADDLNYQLMPESTGGFWAMDGPEITTWSDATTACGRHYLYTPARLGNFLQTFSNLCPPYLVRIAHAIMIVVGIMMTVIMIGGARARFSALWFGITALAAWIILPFDDCMISSDFAFNYFWTWVLTLAFAKYFLAGKRHAKRPRLRMALAIILAILAGTCHEAASLPCIAAGAVILILDRDHRRYRATLLAVYAVASLSMFLSPGTLHRLTTSSLLPDEPWGYVAIMIHSYGAYLTIAALLLAILKGDLRRFARDNAFAIVAMILSWAIAIGSMTRGRGLWMVDVWGLIIFGRALVAYFPWWRGRHRLIGWVCVIFTCFSMFWCAGIQTRMLNTHHYGYRSENESPWWTFNIPCSHLHPSINIYDAIKSHNGNIYEFHCISQDSVPGNTGMKGRYPMLYADHPIADHPVDHLWLTFGSPYPVSANPIFSIINRWRPNARSSYPCREWIEVDQDGDSTWCYLIFPIRQLDCNRPITSIDYEK